MTTLDTLYPIQPLRYSAWPPDDDTQNYTQSLRRAWQSRIPSEPLLEWQRGEFHRKFEVLVTLISKVISSLKLKKLKIQMNLRWIRISTIMSTTMSARAMR